MSPAFNEFAPIGMLLILSVLVTLLILVISRLFGPWRPTSRKTAPYEVVRALFNRPDLPPMRLHASASIATVIHMAIEGLGIAVIPTAIVESEMADGRLQLLSTNLQLPLLTFSASWLASPDTVAVERVAELAANLAQGSVIVDAPRQPRH